MPKNPLISVILPVYNAQDYLSEAIQSILNQSFTDFELIIINDCSTDKSLQIIDQFAKQDSRIIKINNRQNLKLSHSLNIGIAKSRGVYIARMDADDISLPNRFNLQVKFLDKHPKVGIVGGIMSIINAKGKLIGSRHYALTDQQIRHRIFQFSPFSHPLVMIRKSVLDQVGGYQHQYNPAEDYELYFRIGQVSQFANLNKVLLKYRVIPKSMTTGSTKKMEYQTINIRRKYFNLPQYPHTIWLKLYNEIHLLSLLILPDSINSRLKLWLFNRLRK